MIWRAWEREPTWGCGGGAPLGSKDKAPVQGSGGQGLGNEKQCIQSFSDMVLRSAVTVVSTFQNFLSASTVHAGKVAISRA